MTDFSDLSAIPCCVTVVVYKNVTTLKYHLSASTWLYVKPRPGLESTHQAGHFGNDTSFYDQEKMSY